jgi:CubicO group peptidase (beta-lactamase class C family)
MKKSYIVLLIFCIMFGGCSTPAIGNKSYDAYMKEAGIIQGFNGAVLVASGDQILFEHGYGTADSAGKTPISRQTVFPIDSITKQFTAAAILKLQEQNKLNILDPLSKYIPDFEKGNEITLHDLLVHTSGIVNLFTLSKFSPDGLLGLSDYTLQDAVNDLKSQPLEFEPGSKFQYTNSGYVLLSYVIEKTSGMDYEEYLEKYIFRPSHMTHTQMDFRNGRKMFDVEGKFNIRGFTPSMSDSLLKLSFGAGGLCSTVEDLFHWDRAFISGIILEPETVKTAFTPYSGDYGYGWEIQNDERYGKVVFHTGGSPGYMSKNTIFRDKDIVIIILMNENSNNGQTVMNQIEDALYNIATGGSWEKIKPISE